MSLIKNPREIEAKSFKLIDKYLTSSHWQKNKREKEIAKRVIHATADFNYARDLIFHPQAIKAGLSAIKKGKNIITDMHMVKAGINQELLSSFGGKVLCFINDEDVRRKSAQLKITRAILAMRKSRKLMQEAIVAIGNAPTALWEVCDLVSENKARPGLIVGLPLGFVGAKEAKQKLRKLTVPYITNRSRKGGSSACAAVINALLKHAYLRRNSSS